MMDPNEVSQNLHLWGLVHRPDDARVSLLGEVRGPAVLRYQSGLYGAGLADALVLDGIAGPKTQQAMSVWGGRVSKNFRWTEFTDSRAGVTLVHRELVRGLQLLRDRIGSAVVVRSGYRTPATNARVGGATTSAHMLGLAADIWPHRPYSEVQRLGAFSGIGTRAGRVLHVDVRHLQPATYGRVTPANPARWNY